VDGERNNIIRRSLAVKDGGMKYGDMKEVSLGEVAGLRGGSIMGWGSGRKKMQLIYYKYNDS